MRPCPFFYRSAGRRFGKNYQDLVNNCVFAAASTLVC